VSHVALLSLVAAGRFDLRPDDLGIAAAVIGLTALPFFFSGVVLAIALTRTGLPVGRIYGIDLIGAGLGCPIAILLLEALDPSTVCLAVAFLAGAASLAFSVAFGRGRWLPALVSVALFAFTVVNAIVYPDLIFVSRMKGVEIQPAQIQLDHWNSHSRVVHSRGCSGHRTSGQGTCAAARAHGGGVDRRRSTPKRSRRSRGGGCMPGLGAARRDEPAYRSGAPGRRRDRRRRR
jgi:hypothetical protein